VRSGQGHPERLTLVGDDLLCHLGDGGGGAGGGRDHLPDVASSVRDWCESPNPGGEVAHCQKALCSNSVGIVLTGSGRYCRKLGVARFG
jgi:hypothetical protein